MNYKLERFKPNASVIFVTRVTGNTPRHQKSSRCYILFSFNVFVSQFTIIFANIPRITSIKYNIMNMSRMSTYNCNVFRLCFVF